MDITNCFGVPVEILTDRGAHFVGIMMSQLYKQLRIHKITTTPYHPQTDGMVERFNATLKSMLRKSLSAFQGQWDEALLFVLGEYRSTPCRATGFTPAELLLGHNIRTPLAVVIYQWRTGEKVVTKPLGRYLVRLVEGMEEMRQLAKGNPEVYKQNYKKNYDKKAKARSFEVGDIVLVRDHNKLQGFKTEMCGPYPVMEVLAGNNYKLHMPDNPRRHSRLHVNMLEKYVTPIAECLWTDEDLQDLGPEMLGRAIGDVPEPEINLEKEDRRKLRKLLVEYKNIFQSKPGRTSRTKIEIKTADAYPFHLPACRVPPIKLPMLEQEVKSLLEEGIIEPSSTQWASPAIIVPKPNGGIRLCIYYRKLNKITTPDVFPMPLIEDLIDRLAQSKVISVLDLVKRYYQVPLHPNSVDKTAFVTPLGKCSFWPCPLDYVEHQQFSSF